MNLDNSVLSGKKLAGGKKTKVIHLVAAGKGGAKPKGKTTKGNLKKIEKEEGK